MLERVSLVTNVGECMNECMEGPLDRTVIVYVPHPNCAPAFPVGRLLTRQRPVIPLLPAEPFLAFVRSFFPWPGAGGFLPALLLYYCYYWHRSV